MNPEQIRIPVPTKTRVYRRRQASERPWTFEYQSEGKTTREYFATLSEAVTAWSEHGQA